MQLLKPEQIACWYQSSIESSGYKSLYGFARDLWKDLTRKGNKAFPPGFLARLIETLMSISVGEKLELAAPNLKEDEFIKLLKGSEGFDRLEGIFILNGADRDTVIAQNILSQLIERLPVFRSKFLMFSDSDLEKSFSLNVPVYPAFEPEKILSELYTDVINQYHQNKFRLIAADIFEIGHPDLFEKHTDRIFYRKMMKATSGITTWTQSVFTLKEESNYIVAKYGEPQVLPLGGYDAISNKGNLSSLIPSELAYMDSETDFDLFDYKFLENQLMYFKRDSGAVFRIRRNILIRINLTEFFEHERHLGLLFAWCLNLSEKIVETFIKDLIMIHISLEGYEPSSLKEARRFFSHFLEEKGIQNKIALIEGEFDFESVQDNSQTWVFAENSTQDCRFVKIQFPQTDEFAKLEGHEQERILGHLINKAIESMVEDADR